MDKVNNEEATPEIVRSRSPIAIAFLICLVVYILNRIMKDVLPCLYSLRRRRSTSDEEEDLPSENVKFATNLHETEHEDINAGDAVRLRGNDTDKYHVVGSKIGNGERFTCYARPYVGQDQSPDNLELVKSAGDSRRRRRSTSDEEEDLLSEDVKIAINPPETEPKDIKVGDVVKEKDSTRHYVVQDFTQNEEVSPSFGEPDKFCELNRDELQSVKSAGDSPRRRRSTSDEEEDLPSENVKIATNPPETEPEDFKIGDVVKEKSSLRHYVVQDFTQNEEVSLSDGEPNKFCEMNRDELQLVKPAGEDALDMVIGQKYLCSAWMAVPKFKQPKGVLANLKTNNQIEVLDVYHNGMVLGKTPKYKIPFYVPALMLKKSEQLNR